MFHYPCIGMIRKVYKQHTVSNILLVILCQHKSYWLNVSFTKLVYFKSFIRHDILEGNIA